MADLQKKSKDELKATVERDDKRRARERQKQDEFMAKMWEGVGAAGTGALWGALGPRGYGFIPDNLFGFVPVSLLIGGVGLTVGFVGDGGFSDAMFGAGTYGTGRWLEDMGANAVQALAAP